MREPSELELKILRRLWARHGAATIHEVIEDWPDTEPPGYTTILKTLQIMRTKGLVTHTRRGRAYVYTAKIQREDHTRRRLRDLLGMAPGRLELFSTLIDEAALTAEEIAEVRRMLAEREGTRE